MSQRTIWPFQLCAWVASTWVAFALLCAGPAELAAQGVPERIPKAQVAAIQAAASEGEEAREELRRRYDALFQVMLNDPRNLDAMFEFAQLATRLGEYEPAISTLERMLIFNPDLPRVRLELGALYYRIGAYSVAESYFAQLAEDPDVPEGVRQRVAEFREEIAQRSARSRLSGRVNVGLRYQTNANGGPADATVRALGLAAELDERFTAQPDYNWFASAVARHTYDLNTRSGSWLESTGQFYLSRQFEQEQVDLVFLELTSGPRLALTEDGMRGPTIRPYATHSYVQFDGDRLYVEGGGGLDAGFPLDELAWLGVGSQLVYQDHGRLWAERDGWQFQTDASITFQPLEELGITLTGWVLHDGARVAYEESNEVAAFLSLTLGLAPKLPGIAGPLLLRPFAGVIRARYEAPDPTIDPATERKDLEIRAGLIALLQIDSTFGLQASLSHTENNSNLPNFEYSNSEFALSLSIDF